MAIPSTGAISMTTIQTEFGGSPAISMSEYYAGGTYVGSGTTGNNGAIPASGTLEMDDFRGSQASELYKLNLANPEWTAAILETSYGWTKTETGGTVTYNTSYVQHQTPGGKFAQINQQLGTTTAPFTTGAAVPGTQNLKARVYCSYAFSPGISTTSGAIFNIYGSSVSPLGDVVQTSTEGVGDGENTWSPYVNFPTGSTTHLGAILGGTGSGSGFTVRITNTEVVPQ